MYKKEVQQSILDVCLASTGSIESLFDFMRANSMQSLAMNPEGDYFTPPVVNAEVVNYYGSKAIVPASIDSSFYVDPTAAFQPETIAFFDAANIDYDDTVYNEGTDQELTGIEMWGAIDAFVVALKNYNLWNKMKVIYPYVGGTITSHSFNLVDPENFKQTYYGFVDALPTGNQGDGIGSYANTAFTLADFDLNNSTHVSFYSQQAFDYSYAMGVGSASATKGLCISCNDSIAYFCVNGITFDGSSVSGNTGLFLVTRSTDADHSFYKRSTGENISHTYERALDPSYGGPLYIHAINDNSGSPGIPSKVITSCVTIGAGLSQDEVDLLHLAIEALQTTLNRGSK